MIADVGSFASIVIKASARTAITDAIHVFTMASRFKSLGDERLLMSVQLALANAASPSPSDQAWPIGQQALDDRAIQRRQAFEFIERDMLVDLVDACVDRPEFDDFRAERCDEAAIRGAAAGAHFRVFDAAMLANGRDCRVAQCAGAGQERFAGEPPVESARTVCELDAVVVQDLFDALTQ